jgi:hypothetical protein
MFGTLAASGVTIFHTMPLLSDWLPSTVVGVTFTVLGAFKIHGFLRGIVGGGGKPAAQRLCGSCPSWSRSLNIAVVCLFLAIGLGNLAYALVVFMGG